MKTGHIRIPEFIEEEFISGLETALKGTRYSPGPLEITRVSQDSERELGYDGILTSLVPFYIQFKRSSFYLPQYKGKLATQREELDLPQSRGFFAFSLHKDKKTRRYLQHNALFQLSRHATAAYVAPLFYRREQLSDFKRMTFPLPWHYEHVMVYDEYFALPTQIRNSRVFSRCITIPPHREVVDDSVSHFYSFTRDGGLGFHSKPEKPTVTVRKLNSMIDYLAEAVIERRGQNSMEWILQMLPTLYEAVWESRTFRSMVKAYLLELDLYPYSSSSGIEKWVFEELDEVSVLLLAEHMLYSDFNIVQYVAKPPL